MSNVREKKTRKQYNAEFKAKVVKERLKEEKTVGQIAAEYGVQLSAVNCHTGCSEARAIEEPVINYALRGLSPDRVRVHVCWGNYHGPHHRDGPLKEIIDLLLTIQCGAFSLEAANPRHEHEWKVFEQVSLPEGKILIPGMIDSCSNSIEHPKVVARRIVRSARVLDRENVIAGTDCGFDTARRCSQCRWAKLRSLVEGARLASQELWP